MPSSASHTGKATMIADLLKANKHWSNIQKAVKLVFEDSHWIYTQNDSISLWNLDICHPSSVGWVNWTRSNKLAVESFQLIVRSFFVCVNCVRLSASTCRLLTMLCKTQQVVIQLHTFCTWLLMHTGRPHNDCQRSFRITLRCSETTPACYKRLPNSIFTGNAATMSRMAPAFSSSKKTQNLPGGTVL